MRTFLTAVAPAIAIAGMYLLDRMFQHQADESFFSRISVRIPAHGNNHNLVGQGLVFSEGNMIGLTKVANAAAPPTN
jgi:hypothetical protein